MSRESSRVRTFFGSKIFLTCAFLLTFAFAFGFARAYFKDYAFREEVKRLESEISKLEKKKLESLELLKYVSSTAYLEDTARVDLNLKKPGERVLFIDQVDPEQGEGGSREVQKTPDGQEISNPLKWWYYFIHRSPNSG
ncbi:MAG: septum formation initiator family protein [Candidatus Magasanikbacteria bacterium]|nr:septum formation initiator family protein [Candidatus Magasanikbacteria bacterium]